jgi:hypothetical protein
VKESEEKTTLLLQLEKPRQQLEEGRTADRLLVQRNAALGNLMRTVWKFLRDCLM